MKRPLHIVGNSTDPVVHAPRAVSIGERLISIAGTGDERSVLQFVGLLVDGGAAPVDLANDARVDTRIVIRGTPNTASAHLRAEALEAAADVVLGSARPAFARLFTSACARWVSS